MLTFTSEHRLEEVRWMPSGDLIGLRSRQKPPSAEETAEWDTFLDELSEEEWSPEYYALPMPTIRTELVVWSFSDFSERSSMTVRGPQLTTRNGQPRSIEIEPSGNWCWVSGSCVQLNSDGVFSDPNRTPVYVGSILAISSDGSRVLASGSGSYPQSSNFGEWRRNENSSQEVVVDRAFPQPFHERTTYFYGPDNRTLYCKRGSSTTIDTLGIVMNPERERHQISSGYGYLRAEHVRTGTAFAERSFKANYGSVSGRWQSLDGKLIVLAQKKLSVVLFENPLRVETLSRIALPEKINCISIHHTNRFLILSRQNSNLVEVCDLVSRSIIRQFDWKEGIIRCVDCSPDGTMIAAIAGDNKIIVWDVDF